MLHHAREKYAWVGGWGGSSVGRAVPRFNVGNNVGYKGPDAYAF